ncbi:MAG: response regulator, partial [Povalibacter sp.]
MTEQSTIVAKEAMTEPAAARVLILCDHIEQTQVLCRTLESQGYEAIGVSASDALTQLHPGRFDLMITDLNAPQIDVLNLLSAARRIDPELVCVSTTGNAGSDFGIRARQLGVDVLPKSFDPEVMPLLAHRSLEMRRLRRENAELLRRQSELQLELELANREIESFSAAVSHDLRAPLRRISGFGSLLKDEYGPTLRP